jgi:hypothetical protein
MTKQQFNIEIAERVMGWETLIVPTAESSSGYLYDSGAMRGYIYGPDFTTDHNAAALVRARVAELGKATRFIDELYLIAFPSGTMITGTYAEVTAIMNATPAQTARAAYVAVTGERLEACDE